MATTQLTDVYAGQHARSFDARVDTVVRGANTHEKETGILVRNVEEVFSLGSQGNLLDRTRQRPRRAPKLLRIHLQSVKLPDRK